MSKLSETQDRLATAIKLLKVWRTAPWGKGWTDINKLTEDFINETDSERRSLKRGKKPEG